MRRPQSPNASFVHRLLEHLGLAAFDAAPRFLGIDEEGREILTYIAGDVPSDCRSLVWTDEQLRAVSALLRRFHDATAASDLAAGGEVVCHNDFGPWNLVWKEGLPIATIDYDNAAPGARLDDLGYATWKCLNLGLIDVPVGEQRRRARLFSETYGVSADADLLNAISRAQERMRDLISAAPPASPRNDAVEQNVRERDWLRANGPELAS